MILNNIGMGGGGPGPWGPAPPTFFSQNHWKAHGKTMKLNDLERLGGTSSPRHVARVPVPPVPCQARVTPQMLARGSCSRAMTDTPQRVAWGHRHVPRPLLARATCRA